MSTSHQSLSTLAFRKHKKRTKTKSPETLTGARAYHANGCGKPVPVLNSALLQSMFPRLTYSFKLWQSDPLVTRMQPLQGRTTRNSTPLDRGSPQFDDIVRVTTHIGLIRCQFTVRTQLTASTKKKTKQLSVVFTSTRAFRVVPSNSCSKGTPLEVLWSFTHHLLTSSSFGSAVDEACYSSCESALRLT